MFGSVTVPVDWVVHPNNPGADKFFKVADLCKKTCLMPGTVQEITPGEKLDVGQFGVKAAEIAGVLSSKTNLLLAILIVVVVLVVLGILWFSKSKK